MAKKTTKKVNVKDEMKKMVNEIIFETFKERGLDIENGAEYGFTKGTIVVHGESCDMQIKLVTPKAGVDRYEKPEDDEEE